MKLSQKHIEIINLYCGDAIGCNQSELAQLAGTSTRTVQRVLAEPEAQEIIKRLTDRRINMYRPAILEAMAKQAKAGCVASQRNYCQVTGDIGTGGQTNIVKVEQHNEKDSSVEERAAGVWEKRTRILSENS
jgi:hypothetical protein